MYLHVYVSCSCVVSGYSVINAKSLLSVSIFNSLLNVIETCKIREPGDSGIYWIHIFTRTTVQGTGSLSLMGKLCMTSVYYCVDQVSQILVRHCLGGLYVI